MVVRLPVAIAAMLLAGAPPAVAFERDAINCADPVGPLRKGLVLEAAVGGQLGGLGWTAPEGVSGASANQTWLGLDGALRAGLSLHPRLALMLEGSGAVPFFGLAQVGLGLRVDLRPAVDGPWHFVASGRRGWGRSVSVLAARDVVETGPRADLWTAEIGVGYATRGGRADAGWFASFSWGSFDTTSPPGHGRTAALHITHGWSWY
jgi:hypothetical protein